MYYFNVKKIEDNYFAINKNRYFKITEITYIILTALLEKKNNEQIVKEINTLYNTNYNESFLLDFINSKDFKKLNAENIKSDLENKLLFFKINLINPNKIKFIFKMLAFLLKPKIVIFCLFIFFLSIFYSIFYYFNFNNNLFLFQFNFENVISVQTILFIFIIFHEFGHATATYFYGLIAKNIGFAIYFIQPVLFTELTEIWTLSKFKRIVINFAGIYFQIIIHIILIIILCLNVSNKLILQIIIVNFISILLSLNPFYKNDGYWIFSDYFEFNNLEFNTNIFLNQLLTNKLIKLPYHKYIHIFIIYSIANLTFWVYIFYTLFKLGILKIRFYFKEEIFYKFNFETIYFIGYSVFIICVIFLCFNKFKYILNLQK